MGTRDEGVEPEDEPMAKFKRTIVRWDDPLIPDHVPDDAA